MSVLGRALGVLVRVWLWTLRVTVVGAGRTVGERPWIYAFWHGTQFPLLARPRRRATAVLVSWSRDGALQTGIMDSCGMLVVRGSSSRGGARGLRALIGLVRSGPADAAFAVDGPRGPERRAKAGVLVAARAAGGLVVPVGVAVERSLVLDRAWDRFVVPLPFTRVVVVLGSGLEPGRLGTPDVDEAIDRAQAVASTRLRLRVTARARLGILRARAHR